MDHRWPTIEERPVRFALAGYGRVAPCHVAALAAMGRDEAGWAGVADVDADARTRAREDLDVPTFDDYASMLEVEPDVVVLATPSGLHPAQAVRAFERGAHVVTEKPMATNWADARRMVRAAENANRALFIVRQRRYNPAIVALKQAADSGRFGRIFAVQLNLFWTRPQSYYDMAAWRGTRRLDGGTLMNQAIHYVDLLRWIVGPVDSVHAFASTLARRIEVEDTAVLNLRWRSGALGSVTTSMLTSPRNYEGSITVVGERGVVRLGGLACSRIDTWQFDEPTVADEELASRTWRADGVYGDGHVPLYRNVLSALRGEAFECVEGAEGLEAFEVVVAAYRSARQRRRVSLPLET